MSNRLLYQLRIDSSLLRLQAMAKAYDRGDHSPSKSARQREEDQAEGKRLWESRQRKTSSRGLPYETKAYVGW